MMMGMMIMPIRIFGSRTSSFSSLTRMFLKPLSIANHLRENFFEVRAAVERFQLCWFAFDDDFAFVHEGNAVAEIFNLEHVVAAQQHGYAMRLHVLFYDLPDVICVQDIQAACWFIQNRQFRLSH